MPFSIQYEVRYESNASCFGFILNVAPGRVCRFSHRIATLCSATRIIDAFNTAAVSYGGRCEHAYRALVTEFVAVEGQSNKDS